MTERPLPVQASATRRAAALVLALCTSANAQAQGARPPSEAPARARAQKLRQEASLLSDLERLTSELVGLRDTLDDLGQQREQIAVEIREADRQSRALEARLAERRQHLRHGARRLYKLSRGGFLRLLLDSHDGEQAFRRMSGVRRVLKRDASEMSIYAGELKDLAHGRRQLEARRAEQLRLEETLKRKFERLEHAQAEQSQALARVRSSQGLRKELVAELDGQEHHLVEQIRLLRYRLRRAGGFASLKGELPVPVGGPVVGVFGRALDEEHKLTVLRRGITFRPFRNARVRAVHAGTVQLARPLPGYGQLVLLSHSHEYFTLYGFLCKTEVTQGQRVQRGTVLGQAGVDPLTGRVAVYFEIRRKERPLDPAAWLRLAPADDGAGKQTPVPAVPTAQAPK